MKLVYDRWKVTALTHREKILTDFQKKYHKNKTFIPDLKTSSLIEQQKALKPIFQDYDLLRPDEGIFKSVDDFLSRPFYYLSVYEKIKNFLLLKKEFPFGWLKHYNTWEMREAAHLRMQNSLSGITIVDSLSSIVGFDFFSGAELKNFERMPSDFAYLNIQNALVFSQITQVITRIKSHMLGNIPFPDKRLSLPLSEAALSSQLEAVCRSNPEFSMKETAISAIRLPELIYIDGVSMEKKYPGCKEGDFNHILYNELISGKHQVHAAISQYLPSTEHYRVKLMLLELTDIGQDFGSKGPAGMKRTAAEMKQNHIAKASAEMKQNRIKAAAEENGEDRLAGEAKIGIEFELARKMELARKDYEVFYQKHWNYAGLNQLKQRMEIFLEKVTPDTYFLALEGFYEKAAKEFHMLLNIYGSHFPIKDMEKLYLFYTDEYGKLNNEKCERDLCYLILGEKEQYTRVLLGIFDEVSSYGLKDYAFYTPAQLFENLDRYFPLYHKTMLLEKLAELFPDFLASLSDEPKMVCSLMERFSFCRTFYEYACKLSRVFGFSFDRAAALPQGMELSYEAVYQDEVLIYFHSWLTEKLNVLSNMENPPLSTGYGFPICLSEIDLPRVFDIITFNLSWISGKNPRFAENMHPGRFFYLDGKPVESAEKGAYSLNFDNISEIAKSISRGHHILDVPCFYMDKSGHFKIVFLRIYDRTGVLPNDNARKKHTPKEAMKTGENLVQEMDIYCMECIKYKENAVAKNQEMVKQNHLQLIKAYEDDRILCVEIKEEIAARQKKLTAKKEELKKLRTAKPFSKPSAGKVLLSNVGMFRKSLKHYNNELSLRKEQLSEMEKQIMECKDGIKSRQQDLLAALKSEDVLRLYKKYCG